MGQAELEETEQAGGEHRFEHRLRNKAVSATQQTQVVVSAVQNEISAPQRLQKRGKIQRCKRVNQFIGARQTDLDEAELFRIRVQTVGFRVERQPVRRANARQQSSELVIAVNHTSSKARARRKIKVDCEKRRKSGNRGLTRTAKTSFNLPTSTPVTHMNLAMAFAASAEMNAGKTAVFCGDAEYSYEKLQGQAGWLAARLQKD